LSLFNRCVMFIRINILNFLGVISGDYQILKVMKLSALYAHITK